jgi:hypothetical protein
MEHSPTSATGTGWEPTPWHATERAAWAALRKERETLSFASWSRRKGSAQPQREARQWW